MVVFINTGFKVIKQVNVVFLWHSSQALMISKATHCLISVQQSHIHKIFQIFECRFLFYRLSTHKTNPFSAAALFDGSKKSGPIKSNNLDDWLLKPTNQNRQRSILIDVLVTYFKQLLILFKINIKLIRGWDEEWP